MACESVCCYRPVASSPFVGRCGLVAETLLVVLMENSLSDFAHWPIQEHYTQVITILDIWIHWFLLYCDLIRWNRLYRYHQWNSLDRAMKCLLPSDFVGIWAYIVVATVGFKYVQASGVGTRREINYPKSPSAVLIMKHLSLLSEVKQESTKLCTEEVREEVRYWCFSLGRSGHEVMEACTSKKKERKQQLTVLPKWVFEFPEARILSISLGVKTIIIVITISELCSVGL